MRDPWRDFLARVLPWFDQAKWDRERASSEQIIAESKQVQGTDRIRAAYRLSDERLRR